MTICKDSGMTREMRLIAASVNIVNEARRALEKHGPENTMDAPGKTDGERLAILMEEVGEVAHELTYDSQGETVGFVRSTQPESVQAEMTSIDGKPFVQLLGSSVKTPVAGLTDKELEEYYGWTRVRQSHTDRLRKELIQVGAMAATWIAYIDSEENG